MNVLIIGANGYIGTRLSPLLLEKWYEVYALFRSEKHIQVPAKCEKQVHIIQAHNTKVAIANEIELPSILADHVKNVERVGILGVIYLLS